jgi:hypothetical protein
MDIRAALKEQYHAGLAMLAQCVERCPDDLWIAPNPLEAVAPSPDSKQWPTASRAFWRIVFHNLYFTHLYLGQGEEAFRPAPPESAVGGREEFAGMWQPPLETEPYDLAADVVPPTKPEVLEYLAYVDGLIDATVDGLDLNTTSSGFSWYTKHTKLSHELMNLRHLQGHVGQLSELLMLHGIDTDWIGRR